MENKGYLIYEVGNIGGNDNGEIKFILFLMFSSDNIIINDVVINNNSNFSNLGENDNFEFYSGIVIASTKNLSINNLTINNNSNAKFYKGVLLDDIENATINNLTVNNSIVGLYVHRYETDMIDSNIEVNNSNLLNNTCSNFNILDDSRTYEGIVESKSGNSSLTAYNLPFILNKNYQVVFNSGNMLNCAVASGNDTNTYVSGNNMWNKEPISSIDDEINYDNLTDSIQNINEGTVDLGKIYKGTITIEEGSSSAIDNAFESSIDLSKNITWSSEDDSIAGIENGNILGLKEGITKITGISSDGLDTYEIEVTVINNPKTNNMIYVGVGIILILILGTALYAVYRIKVIVYGD